MQIIHLIRKSKDGKAVRGVMRVDGREIATIENDDYIIPCGTYPVRVTWSPKFKRMLPILLNVPGRSGIRVHRGYLETKKLKKKKNKNLLMQIYLKKLNKKKKRKQNKFCN